MAHLSNQGGGGMWNKDQQHSYFFMDLADPKGLKTYALFLRRERIEPPHLLL